MKKWQKERRRLLHALIEYAENDQSMNPHFYRKDMLERLDISDADFNKAINKLGNRCCIHKGEHKGDERFEINMGACYNLRDAEKKHGQLIFTAIVAAIIGAVLAAILTSVAAKIL